MDRYGQIRQNWQILPDLNHGNLIAVYKISARSPRVEHFISLREVPISILAACIFVHINRCGQNSLESTNIARFKYRTVFRPILEDVVKICQNQ